LQLVSRVGALNWGFFGEEFLAAQWQEKLGPYGISKQLMRC